MRGFGTKFEKIWISNNQNNEMKFNFLTGFIYWRMGNNWVGIRHGIAKKQNLGFATKLWSLFAL